MIFSYDIYEKDIKRNRTMNESIGKVLVKAIRAGKWVYITYASNIYALESGYISHMRVIQQARPISG